MVVLPFYNALIHYILALVLFQYLIQWYDHEGNRWKWKNDDSLSSCICDWKWKCMVKVSFGSERTSENVPLWNLVTSHFMVLCQKSMNVAFFQRFVEYNRPTWKQILRHIVSRNLWAPGFLFNGNNPTPKSDSSTRNSVPLVLLLENMRQQSLQGC